MKDIIKHPRTLTARDIDRIYKCSDEYKLMGHALTEPYEIAVSVCHALEEFYNRHDRSFFEGGVKWI